MTMQAKEPLLLALGQRVRSLREARGWTRRTLSEESGLSERFVADVEAGRGNISVLKLADLAAALEVLPARLLGTEASSDGTRVVALLGLRGAGKSTVGKLLAQKLGVPFFELDRLVEQRAGMALGELFAMHGEGYFRTLELDVLRRLLQQESRAVIATGGGLVTSPDAFELISSRATTVWLRATAEEHWERVLRQGDLRPMQNRPQAMAELRRRLREREPLYSRAELTVSTSGQTPGRVAAELARRLRTPAVVSA